MKIVLEADIPMAKRYLDKLGDTEYTFQTFDDSPRKSMAKAKVLHGTLETHADELIHLNNCGAGIFVMVNRGDGNTKEGKNTCRTNKNVIAVRALFADADGTPIGPILKKCPPPHILVESSPDKWHIYWLTNDTKLEEFKSRQQAIANALGTDPAVNDLSRVLRLPGFFHQKNEPFMSRLVTG
ncbi:RepB-like DNA primase domain containing protein [Methylophilaceae bacterium]|jgi:hypothetical protein